MRFIQPIGKSTAIILKLHAQDHFLLMVPADTISSEVKASCGPTWLALLSVVFNACPPSNADSPLIAMDAFLYWYDVDPPAQFVQVYEKLNIPVCYDLSITILLFGGSVVI